MQWVLISITLAGCGYFALAQRVFDWFSIAFFGMCLYFSSGFLGFAYLYDEKYLLSEPSLTVMALAMGMVLVTGIGYDRLTSVRPAPVRLEILNHPHFAGWLVVTGFVFLVLSWSSSGAALFNPNKIEMMETFNRWHVLWMMSALMGAVYAFALRQFLLCGAAMLHLLFILFVGFRMPLVLAVVGIATVYLSRKGPQRLLIDSRRVLLPALGVVLFVFVFKQVYVYVKMGQFKEAYEDRLATPYFFRDAFLHSEAALQGLVIHEVMAANYRVGPEHLAETFNEAFRNPFRTLSDRVPVSFNAKFQPVLFPEVHGGIASSIWAEMWSAGGWGLLLAWTVFFSLALAGGSVLMRSAPLQGALACWFPFWAFFIHRNDLNALLSFFFKQFLVLLLFVTVLVAIEEQLGFRRTEERAPA